MFKATENATTRGESNLKGQQQGPYRFDIQLFAEGDQAPPGDAKADGKEAEDKAKAAEKITLTQAELDAKLQTETDKRVSQAMKTAQEKWDKDLTAKLADVQKEAERLAKLSADDREKEVLSKTQKEIADKEAALARREMELATIDILQEKKLPLEFKTFVLGADKDATAVKIEALAALFQKSVEAAVTEKLKGTPPAKGMENSGGFENPFSKEHWNLTKQGELMKKDPTLAKQLMANRK